MSAPTIRTSFSVLFMLFSGALAMADQGTTASSKRLFSFEESGQLSQITASGVEMEIAGTEKGNVLRVESGHEIDWPGITFLPRADFFDATGYQNLSLDVTNVGDKPFELGTRIDNPGGDGQKDSVTKMTYLKPGESRVVTASLADTPWAFPSR